MSIVHIQLSHVPSFMEEKTLLQSGLKDQFDILVLIHKRGNETCIAGPSLVFKKGDTIVVCGSLKQIKHIFENPDKEKL